MEAQHRNGLGPQEDEEPSLGSSDQQEQPTPDAIELLERSRAYLQQLAALAGSRSLDPAELVQQLRRLE